MLDIAIIGAGPYGLSIAAHLKARGLDFRIFGRPMHNWLTQMPKGMRLKSEGFASSLYDPKSEFTLADFCQERGIPYADMGLPVALDTFASYGLEFKNRFVPELEDKNVDSVHRSKDGFRIWLEDGEVVATRRVIVAVGICHYEYVPPLLSPLPEEFVTHSSRHRNPECLHGREVVVVGAGASALDLAALLHQSGASVRVVARKPAIRFHDPLKRIPRPLLDQIRNPTTGIGPGWKLAFCTRGPLLFRCLPEQLRHDAVRRILGPAPGWFIKEQVVGKVPFTLGVTISDAKVKQGRLSLGLTDNAGDRQTVAADHVIAATGYKVDIRRLTFLSSEIQAGIRLADQTPVLQGQFESSIPGLYFVGASAANTFGPLMRFAYGARFTAKCLSRHLAKSASRKPTRDRAKELVLAR